MRANAAVAVASAIPAATPVSTPAATLGNPVPGNPGNPTVSDNSVAAAAPSAVPSAAASAASGDVLAGGAAPATSSTTSSNRAVPRRRGGKDGKDGESREGKVKWSDTALTSYGREGARSIEPGTLVGLENAVPLSSKAMTHLNALLRGREPVDFEVALRCSNAKCPAHLNVAGDAGKMELARHSQWRLKQSDELEARDKASKESKESTKEATKAWLTVLDGRAAKRPCHVCYPGLPALPPADCQTLSITLWMGRVRPDTKTGLPKLVTQRDKVCVFFYISLLYLKCALCSLLSALCCMLCVALCCMLCVHVLGRDDGDQGRKDGPGDVSEGEARGSRLDGVPGGGGGSEGHSSPIPRHYDREQDDHDDQHSDGRQDEALVQDADLCVCQGSGG
jgi:hypothetical protein